MNRRILVAVSLLVGVASGQQPDFRTSQIANMPVGGKMGGDAFRVAAVELNRLGFDSVKFGNVSDRARKYHLEFKATDEFMPANHVTVMFTTDVNRSVSGLKILFRKPKMGSDEAWEEMKNVRTGVTRGVVGIHVNLQGRPTQMEMDGYSGRIEFGTLRNGRISGRVVLVLADGSYLNGTFNARYKAL